MITNLTLRNFYENMIIGCPLERKVAEGRVGLAPGGVLELVKAGCHVLIQQNAGVKAGFSNREYATNGAEIVAAAEDIYGRADLIVKVKEPQLCEWSLVRPGQILLAFFHFCADENLTRAMLRSGAVCLAYETVQEGNRLPLLEPMSEIAGKLSIQVGMHYLETPRGGAGVLLGGVPGVPRGRVLIIGGGVVGTSAAQVAAGVGADVLILDKSVERLRYLSQILPANVATQLCCEETLAKVLPYCDLLIGAVLLPGCKAPKIIRREHLAIMKRGSVIVDVAVDHGGCVETSKVTTHENPVFTVDGIIHYGVSNMPGAVAHTSTIAITNATLPYVLQVARDGWEQACKANVALMKGLNVAKGKIVFEGVAKAFNMDFYHLDKVLQRNPTEEEEGCSTALPK